MKKEYLDGLFIGLLLLLLSCSDEEMIRSNESGNLVPGKIELRLIIPVTTDIVTNTRANSNNEASIKTLHIVTYKEDKTCVDCREVVISELIPNNDGSYKLILDLQKEISDIHLVANAGALLDDKPTGALYDLYSTDNIATPLLMWGHIKVIDIKRDGTAATISLLRNVAKATLTVDESVKNFEVTGWKVTHTASSGSIAPKNYNSPTETTCKTDEAFDREIGSLDNKTNVLYFYETPGERNTRIVIEGKNTGETRYYTALFLKNNRQLSLLRNHHYQIMIKGVSSAGYASEEDALNAPAGNIDVEIKDHNYLISNIISNGEYELGVPDTIYVLANGGNFNDGKAYCVTMWGKDNMDISNLQPAVIVNSGNENWLKEASLQALTDITPGDDSSIGKGYIIQFTCEKNPKEDVRYGGLQVIFGELSRNIVLKQEGTDFKKERESFIIGLAGDAAGGRNYLLFVEEVQGITATAMGGDTRNNGLQLGLGNETENYRYNYTYKIKKNTGDTYQVSNSTRISCQEQGDYYVINAKDVQDSSWWIEKAGFQITNSEGVEIKYDLYHTGIFWEENPQDIQPDNEDLSRKGWYYYEPVPSPDGLWIFDRNMGATSVNDAGAYYLLKKGNKDQKQVDICPPGYIIPSIYLWNDLLKEIKIITRYNEDGSSFKSMEIEGRSGPIRFPRKGYCIGKECRNEAIGYYWSTSLLSGNQGFDINSAEYGYWYRISRLSTNGCDQFSVRYADGNNGAVTEPYRYINVRCVKISDDLIGNKNELTIIDKRPEEKRKTESLFIYLFTEGEGYRNCPGGELIRKASGDGSEMTLYYDMIDPDLISTSIGKPLLIQFKSGNNWLNYTEVGSVRTFIVE